MTNRERNQDDETEWGDDTWPKKLPKDEVSTHKGRRDGGELMTAQTKNTLRQLLMPITSTTEACDLSQEDEDVFAEYKRWLLRQVKARKERYRQHMREWDTISEEQSNDSGSIPPAWQQWYACHRNLRADPHLRGRTNEVSYRFASAVLEAFLREAGSKRKTCRATRRELDCRR